MAIVEATCDAAVVMELPGRMTIEGDVDAQDELAVGGEVRGTIWAETHTVVVAPTGFVNGRVVAAEVIVRGLVSGSILASRSVEIAGGGRVEGRIVAPELIVQEGAVHAGAFQPNRVDLAFIVARHRRDQAGSAEDKSVDAPAQDAPETRP